MRLLNKGITMVEIVVVIIILILLAVIAIWNTNGTYKKAEMLVVFQEFNAVYKGAMALQTFYNSGAIDDYVQGEHYCTSHTTVENGVEKTWYTIYGMDFDGQTYYNIPGNEAIYDKIVSNWGIDELKRSYDVYFGKEIEVKYSNGNYVQVGEYKIHSYSEIRTLQESGAI